MVAAEQKNISREAIHRAVDELGMAELSELATFVAYLQYKEEHDMDWFYRLQKRFAPVQDAADQMSEAEVNQAIDDAIAAVRRER